MYKNHILIIIAALLSPLLVSAQTVYEIKFISGVTQHRGALVLYNNGTGKMRVRYYSQQEGPAMIEQEIRLENTNFGYRLTGYNPVYPGTTRRKATYNADNFYISRDESGKSSIVNIDDKGSTAQATIREIAASEKTKFLYGFNWRLD